MRYNANKGEITRVKAKKRESKMRNKAYKGKKNRESQMRNNANKGEKRESQMRNNANKGEITRKSNVLKRQTQLCYNAFKSFVSQFRVISVCLHVKACPAILYYWQRPCFLS